jgi:ankyrin repeat protein
MQQYPDRLDEIKSMLQWLVASESAVSTAQLAEAVAISRDDTALDFDRVYTDSDDVVEPISQLVLFDTSVPGETVVKLCHFSLEEYLCAGPKPTFRIDIREAHQTMAEKCLQYLSFSDFDVPEDHVTLDFVDSCLQKYSLLEYAAIHWVSHYRKSGLATQAPNALEQHVKLRLDWFMDPDSSPSHFALFQMVIEIIQPWDNRFLDSTNLTFAIANRLDSTVNLLLPELSNINAHLPDGHTCLTAAACGNNLLVAKQLIDMGAEFNLPTDDDRVLTPLHFAAEFACEEVFEYLVSDGASINSRSGSGTTPFYRAARAGSVRILRLLHEMGSDVEAETWDKWTPLMEAVEREHERIVQILLQWGANPNNLSTYHVTPMEMAALTSQDGILSMLEAAAKDQDKQMTDLPGTIEEALPLR